MFWSLLLSAWVWGAHPMLAMRLSRGHFIHALAIARRSLATNPDDLATMVGLGVASRGMGFYADGLAAFELSGEVIRSQEINAKCDMQRWFDRDPLVQCRRSHFTSEWTTGEKVTLWMGILDDVRWKGRDPEGLVDKALSEHPGSPLLHATAADWYLDQGAQDLAEWHLWLGQQQGRNLRLVLVEARILAQQGDCLLYTSPSPRDRG